MRGRAKRRSREKPLAEVIAQSDRVTRDVRFSSRLTDGQVGRTFAEMSPFPSTDHGAILAADEEMIDRLLLLDAIDTFELHDSVRDWSMILDPDAAWAKLRRAVRARAARVRAKKKGPGVPAPKPDLCRRKARRHRPPANDRPAGQA